MTRIDLVQGELLVAIGDIHGAHDALENLLAALHHDLGLFTDATAHQLRPGARLVFTGDYIDRGPDSRRVLARLMEMKQASGAHLSLLRGNHELMALAALGELVDATISNSPSERLRAVRRFHSHTTHGINGGDQLIGEWAIEGDEPDAFIEACARYLEEMRRDGPLGAFIRNLDLFSIQEVHGRRFLFSHGDIPRDLQSGEKLRREWQDFEDSRDRGTAGDWSVKYGGDSPGARWMWGRGFSSFRNGRDSTSEVRDICERSAVDYIVAGHTPTDGEIAVYGGRIFHVDVGMVLGRAPRALVVDAHGIHSFGPGHERPLVTFD